MQVLELEKKRLFEFLSKLKQSYELIAPVKKDLVRFEKIEDVNEIYFDKNSYFPLKEYFFRKNETLFQFSGTKITVPQMQNPKRVFFGIRRCDLNAVRHQDMVFEKANDPYYMAARKDSFLLGYHCNTAPSPFCFCGSLDLVDYYDLMFYDRNEKMLVEVGSEKGKMLIDKFREFFAETDKTITKEEKVIPGADRLENKDISKLYDHPDWKKGVDICLSCAACTNVCPTCYCFEIHDEVTAKDQTKGSRKRDWSSCQLPDFTRVAGEHVFRKDRGERFKHRIYHQLEYFKEKNGINLCVGCGRCIEGCPTRIDFVEIINGMK
ncbi:MAG TPA: 4Fe-4S dicluster domain-containing protein [Candidatus Nanoarchaeia archaeon]|nr:4Fe-4S dicluster domain-containing protein [Candidatus Nanoarchaeia archaeon]